MTVTSELVDRLRRHYIKDPASPGGMFITECGLNNGFGPQRRVDALHVGFTRTSGQLLRGHEVKVSRADWLHELDQPEKAEFWSSQCHEWWLVTPVTEIVALGELPPGWGHMVPDPRSKTRFKVLVRADRKTDAHAPSWLAVRSILARIDSLTQADRREERQQIEREARAKAEADLDRRAAQSLPWKTRQRVGFAEQVEAELGLAGERHIDYDAARKALRLAPLLDQLAGSWGGFSGVEKAAKEMLTTLGEARAELDRITADTQPDRWRAS